MKIYWLVALLMLNASLVSGVTSTSAPTTRPTLSVPRATLTPRVDATSDDPAWASAAKIDSLSLSIGPQGAGLKPTPTEVRLLWDEHFLYVRFICQDDDIYAPHGMQHNAAHSQGDVAEVFIDPVGDGRQYIELAVNPVGGVFNGKHVITTQPVSKVNGLLADDVIRRNAWFFPDPDLDGLRIVAAPLDQPGKQNWIADFAVPADPLLHRLARKTFQPMTLRANLLRYDAFTPLGQNPKPESILMNWSPVVWGRPHRSPAAMGTLILSNH